MVLFILRQQQFSEIDIQLIYTDENVGLVVYITIRCACLVILLANIECWVVIKSVRVST